MPRNMKMAVLFCGENFQSMALGLESPQNKRLLMKKHVLISEYICYAFTDWKHNFWMR